MSTSGLRVPESLTSVGNSASASSAGTSAVRSVLMRAELAWAMLAVLALHPDPRTQAVFTFTKIGHCCLSDTQHAAPTHTLKGTDCIGCPSLPSIELTRSLLSGAGLVSGPG